MRIIFLGTSSARPTLYRNVSSLLLQLPGENWLFDCGEGTQQQMLKLGYGPSLRIRRIFITHLHGDHVYGLPGMLCGIAASQSDAECPPPPTEIYGPSGLRQWIHSTLRTTSATLHRIHVHEINKTPKETESSECDANGQFNFYCNSSSICTLINNSTYIVQCGLLQHSVPSWGYVISEKEKQGNIDAKKLTEMGVPPGPFYKKLIGGDLNDIVELPNNMKIRRGDVVSPPKKGRKIVILGDTCNSDNLVPIAQNADVLVHEATLPGSMEELAATYHHSTARMAAKFAEKIKARVLILTHFSPRLQTPEDFAELLGHAKAHFSGEVLLAKDFFAFDVPSSSTRN
jgi:ribonuclease Z